jgi:protein involved in temperature-dependent protein secretion
MFLMYNMVDDAIKICVDGVNRFPEFISGRIALAKAYIAKSEWRKAREQVKRCLKGCPTIPRPAN